MCFCFLDQCFKCYLVSVRGYPETISLGKVERDVRSKDSAKKKGDTFTQKFCAYFFYKASFAPLYIIRS